MTSRQKAQRRRLRARTYTAPCWIDNQHDKWDPKNEFPERLYEFFTDVKMNPQHEGGGAILLGASGAIQKIAIRLPNGKGRQKVTEYSLRQATGTFGVKAVIDMMRSAGLQGHR